ncbi:hypothetical protein MEBOL_003716 [Melittangium boletus DSM 14713]|uniref:DUF2381 family protein n=1 Tax=Melittangium boletus DSM 14713 TaxID=1294270 RepID=A0A250IH51_9BACT|nr:hypothetical protein MEBOL_003716 [Melittangium boletus DSM 14713]
MYFGLENHTGRHHSDVGWRCDEPHHFQQHGISHLLRWTQEVSTLARLLPSLPLTLLLTGATAAAQPPSPARERQERRVTLPSAPDEPGLEVSVAAGITTYLRFDAALDKTAVEVENRPLRFTWVDVGDTLVALEPLVDLGAEEKLVVRVRYRDGASPAKATLALVTRPGVVDKEVEVVRRPRTLEALEAALAESQAELAALKAQSGASGLAGLVFTGRLNLHGVRARRLESIRTSTWNGLAYVGGEGYRAGRWALAVIRVRNLPGQQSWMPGSALLTRKDGTPVKVLSVAMDKAQLAPGEEGLVAVETEAPFWTADEDLRLEFRDKSGGRRLPIPNVNL